MEAMNAAQLAVMLLLKPISKGVGNVPTLVVSAAAMPLDVEVGASVEDEDDFLIVVVTFTVAVVLAELDSVSERRLRSAAARTWGQTLALASGGGGFGSTRIVPERARRSNVDPSGSAASDRASTSTNCSSIYNVGDADESEM